MLCSEQPVSDGWARGKGVAPESRGLHRGCCRYDMGGDSSREGKVKCGIYGDTEVDGGVWARQKNGNAVGYVWTGGLQPEEPSHLSPFRGHSLSLVLSLLNTVFTCTPSQLCQSSGGIVCDRDCFLCSLNICH